MFSNKGFFKDIVSESLSHKLPLSLSSASGCTEAQVTCSFLQREWFLLLPKKVAPEGHSYPKRAASATSSNSLSLRVQFQIPKRNQWTVIRSGVHTEVGQEDREGCLFQALGGLELSFSYHKVII